MTTGLAGCADPARSESLQSPVVAAPVNRASPTSGSGIDISRIANLKHDFPDGFTVESHPAKILDQQDIDVSGVHAFSTAEVHPTHCRALLLPPNAEPSVGTQAAAIRADDEQGAMYVIALDLPRPIPADEAPANCEEASVYGSPGVTGIAKRVAAPKIGGAVTTGANLSFHNGADPDYIFTAALDARTAVVVIGSAHPDLRPQRLLSDLLVKAADAVRGR